MILSYNPTSDSTISCPIINACPEPWSVLTLLSSTVDICAFLPDDAPTKPCTNDMVVSDWSDFHSTPVGKNNPSA